MDKRRMQFAYNNLEIHPEKVYRNAGEIVKTTNSIQVAIHLGTLAYESPLKAFDVILT